MMEKKRKNGDGNYEDIIELSYRKSTKHPHMSMEDRAAQFAPFAALTGHSDAISETAKQAIERMEKEYQ